ncbi:MAG TPA: helix-turn-helix domain-containing protein [Chitinophagaceae bacterium]|nr:helix-turn-helix domain-containing protein [Chitinophagaceae bacterium]
MRTAMHTATQQSFFAYLKGLLPAHRSLVDEVADLLNLSTDSAYRRLRGEKALDFGELQQLASHYKISIDQFLQLSPEALLFTDRSMTAHDAFHFEGYLQAVIADLEYMNGFDRKTMWYLNKDVPIFHHFALPELAAFKCFFWRKTIVHDPVFAQTDFILEEQVGPFEAAGRKIGDLYAALPSVEIWNAESINSTIRQIEYYRHMQLFRRAEDAGRVYAALRTVIDRIEAFAEEGVKRTAGGAAGGRYEVFVNEFILGDNTILVELDGRKFVYVNHGVHHYMLTKDDRFCAFTADHFRNIIRKSTPVSAVNEKERRMFFNRIRRKLNL